MKTNNNIKAVSFSLVLIALQDVSASLSLVPYTNFSVSQTNNFGTYLNNIPNMIDMCSMKKFNTSEKQVNIPEDIFPISEIYLANRKQFLSIAKYKNLTTLQSEPGLNQDYCVKAINATKAPSATLDKWLEWKQQEEKAEIERKRKERKEVYKAKVRKLKEAVHTLVSNAANIVTTPIRALAYTGEYVANKSGEFIAKKASEAKMSKLRETKMLKLRKTYEAKVFSNLLETGRGLIRALTYITNKSGEFIDGISSTKASLEAYLEDKAKILLIYKRQKNLNVK